MKTALSFLFSLCFFCQNGIAQFTRQTDSLALVALYNSTNGANWANKWDLSKPMNTWYGITLDVEGRVTDLNLSQNKLNGIINPSLGNLSKLRILTLKYNKSLSGRIPSQLGDLTELLGLYLDQDSLSGTIPPELGKLTKIVQLTLEGNKLEGNIPVEIGKLTQLKLLYLANNQLTGPIPSDIEKLTQLQDLNLSNNRLTGQIPAGIGKLSPLYSLSLNNNGFNGNIPIEIGRLTNLQFLILNNNQLSGPIPISNLSKLQLLWLKSNKFTFQDLLPIMLLGNKIAPIVQPQPFTYTMQDSIYKDTIIYRNINDTLTINLGIDDTVKTNIYQWYKDKQPHQLINGTNKLFFDNIQAKDEGIYTCQITNPYAPSLTLATREIKLKVTTIKYGTKGIAIIPDCTCSDETLKFDNLEQYVNNELTVINRWGNPVFKAQSYRNNWNGVNQNNQPLPAATYYYVLRLGDKDGKVIGGDVTIIR